MYFIELNVEISYKPSRCEHRTNLCELGLGKDSLAVITTRARFMKETDKLDFTKINFALQKKLRRMTEQGTQWENFIQKINNYKYIILSTCIYFAYLVYEKLLSL